MPFKMKSVLFKGTAAELGKCPRDLGPSVYLLSFLVRANPRISRGWVGLGLGGGVNNVVKL